jgi:hypothetical protein
VAGAGLSLATPRSPHIDGAVGSDPAQPGIHGESGTIAVEVLPQRQEDLLGNFLGLGRITQNLMCDQIHPAVFALEQGTERLCIAGAAERHELTV